MATCADIILLALKDINIVDENETPSASILADSFSTLKQMLNLWQIDGLSIYATQDVTFAPTGALSYTIGSTGTVNTIARPDKIKYSYYELSGLGYPMMDALGTREEYESIALKSVANAIPFAYYYEPTFPNGTLFIYPQASAGLIHIGVDVPFTDYTAAANNLLLPPEYEFVIRMNLAALLGNLFGIGTPPKIEKMANDSKRILDRNNVQIKRNNNERLVSKMARFTGYL